MITHFRFRVEFKRILFQRYPVASYISRMAMTQSGGGGGGSGRSSGRQGRKLKDSTSGNASRQRQSPYGSCDDSDMTSWLKRLAVNPCNHEASKGPGGRLRDQFLKLRKIMFLTHSEFPWVISNLVFLHHVISLPISYDTVVERYSFSIGCIL